MTLRKPVLRVNGPTGGDLVGRWGKALLGVTIVDQEGHESDECTIRLRRTAPWDTMPPKGATYTVEIGWVGEGLAMMGSYTVQRVRRIGDPTDGEEIHVICRAADLIDKAKASASKHYDAENGHGTAGKIFETLAKEAGLQAVIDPALAAIAVPYRLRHRQSVIDFASELADDLGAVVKPQAGKLVVAPRGGGTSGSGKALPPIVLRFDPSYAYEVDLEPRGLYAEVETSFFDAETGRPDLAKAMTSAEASIGGLTHPAPSKDEATRRAKAEADAQNRTSGTGSFECVGMAEAVGGAPVVCVGFGEGVDDVDWRASSVTHEISPEFGWTMTVAVETKEKPKKGGKAAA